VSAKEASKEQDYFWAIEVAYAFSWRELCGKCTRKETNEAKTKKKKQQGRKDIRI